MPSFTATPANWTNSNDANFRAWGSYISARMDAVGLTKTGDTGQIDWATVLTPAGPSIMQGYEIRTFTDALQASAPVFFKIEYGEAAGADNPGIRIQFGSGSTGAGVLTGTVSGVYWAQGTVQAAAVTIHGSGGPARFCMNGGYAGATGMIFGFERSKNAAGEDTTEAVLFIMTNTTGAIAGGRVVGVWSTTLGDIGSITTTLVPALFPPGATAASGTQTIVCPVMHSKGVFMNPGLNFAGFYTENIVAASSPPVYAYGALHTYFTFSPTNSWGTAQFQGPGGGTESLMIRYE